jgi:hypothetical protein
LRFAQSEYGVAPGQPTVIDMGDAAGKACADAHTKQTALSKFEGKNLI